MPKAAAAIVTLALALAAAPAWSQVDEAAEAARPTAPTVFKCLTGGDVVARFATQDARFVAIVDAGDGPHALPAKTTWTGGPAKLTWSDGRRTLIWSPGVQIMWRDGESHRMCGRGEHQH